MLDLSLGEQADKVFPLLPSVRHLISMMLLIAHESYAELIRSVR